MDSTIELLDKQTLVNNIQNKLYKKIVFITGAGISVAAGLPDFRSKTKGVYCNLQEYELPYPEALFDIEYFRDNPEPFYKYCKNNMTNMNIQPTNAHRFMKLLTDNKLLQKIFTQNIDSLEEKIGISKKYIIYSHGNLNQCLCSQCNKKHDIETFQKKVKQGQIYSCEKCNNPIKPSITFYGQKVNSQLYRHVQQVENSDLIFIIGTTLKIQPFSNILKYITKQTPIVLINNELVIDDKKISLFLQGDIDTICQDLIKEINLPFKSKTQKQNSVEGQKNKNKCILI